MRSGGDRLVVVGQGSRRRMAVQLDAGGQMLINWHVEPRWEKCFAHLPATQVLSLVEAERSLHENARRRELMLLEAFRVGNPDSAPAYERDLARLLELQCIAASGVASQPSASAPAEREAVEKRLASQQKETIACIRKNWEAMPGDRATRATRSAKRGGVARQRAGALTTIGFGRLGGRSSRHVRSRSQLRVEREHRRADDSRQIHSRVHELLDRVPFQLEQPSSPNPPCWRFNFPFRLRRDGLHVHPDTPTHRARHGDFPQIDPLAGCRLGLGQGIHQSRQITLQLVGIE